MQVHITIVPAGPADAGELLTLQRAAYVSEAQLYDELELPALVQTTTELRYELSSCIALKAMHGHRMVGAIRGRREGTTLHIGRLVVAPDLQGQGIGTALLRALEQEAAADTHRYELFTGHLSEGNLRLYQRLGYRELRRESLNERVTLVYLDKAVAPTATADPA